MYKNREVLLKELADVLNERDAALAQADEASKYANKMEEKLKELSRKEAMQAECHGVRRSQKCSIVEGR